MLMCTVQVVEAATEDYPEILDLLNRIKTLQDANKVSACSDIGC